MKTVRYIPIHHVSMRQNAIETQEPSLMVPVSFLRIKPAAEYELVPRDLGTVSVTNKVPVSTVTLYLPYLVGKYTDNYYAL